MLATDLISKCRDIRVPVNASAAELAAFIKDIQEVDEKVNAVHASLCDTEVLRIADRERKVKPVMRPLQMKDGRLAVRTRNQTVPGSELTRAEGERWKRSMSGYARAVYKKRKRHLQRTLAYTSLIQVVGPKHSSVVKSCLRHFNTNPNTNHNNCTLWEYLSVYKNPSLLSTKVSKHLRRLMYSVAWSLKHRVSKLRMATTAIVFFNYCRRIGRKTSRNVVMSEDSESMEESIHASVATASISSDTDLTIPNNYDATSSIADFDGHIEAAPSDAVSDILTEHTMSSYRSRTRVPPRSSSSIDMLSLLVQKSDNVASQIHTAVTAILDDDRPQDSTTVNSTLQRATAVAKETVRQADRLTKLRDILVLENKLRSAGVDVESSSISSDRSSDDTHRRIRKLTKKNKSAKVVKVRSPIISLADSDSDSRTSSNADEAHQTDRNVGSTTRSSASSSPSSSPTISRSRSTSSSTNSFKGGSDASSEFTASRSTISSSSSHIDIFTSRRSEMPMVVDSGFTGPRYCYNVHPTRSTSSSTTSSSDDDVIPTTDRRIGRRSLIKKVPRQQRRTSNFTKQVKAAWDMPWRTSIRNPLSSDEEIPSQQRPTYRSQIQTGTQTATYQPTSLKVGDTSGQSPTIIKADVNRLWNRKLSETDDVNRYRESIMSTVTGGTEPGSATSPAFSEILSAQPLQSATALSERRKLSLEKTPRPLLETPSSKQPSHQQQQHHQYETSSTKSSVIRASNFADLDSDVDHVEFESQQSTIASPSAMTLPSMLSDKALLSKVKSVTHRTRYEDDESNNSPLSKNSTDISDCKPIVMYLLASDIIPIAGLCILAVSATTAPDYNFDVLYIETVRESFMLEQRKLLSSLQKTYDDDNDDDDEVSDADENGNDSSTDTASTVGFDPHGLLEEKLVSFCCSSSVDLSVDADVDFAEDVDFIDSSTTETFEQSPTASSSLSTTNSTKEWALSMQRRQFIWNDGSHSSSVVPTAVQFTQMTGSTTTESVDQLLESDDSNDAF
eukprot:TRINITY_DN6188_c0_g1_i1.p1 TRINITY_DN6188_c0_g1~~TRINITY_DN6188_c0_g1_i1.p1  ORF type:complete len:1014 (+),score=236.59 TRINITY_DN6188_c0_g1_i1:34-3075(+)